MSTAQSSVIKEPVKISHDLKTTCNPDGHPCKHIIDAHPPTDDCPDAECMICGMRDCPRGEPMHYDKDGCPVCSFTKLEPFFGLASEPMVTVEQPVAKEKGKEGENKS